MKTTSPSLVVATLVCLATLGIHAALLAKFTDDSLFLTPDFVDYLIGARSLASGQGYRDLSNPDRPMLTRPVGMSALLLPIVGADGPFPIWDCKRLLNALSVVLCLSAGWFASRAFATPMGLFTIVCLAVGPVTVMHGSNLYSEVPYTLCAIWIFGILAKSGGDQFTAKTSLQFAAACIFAFAAEKTRTMGLVLWPALLCAALATRSRWTCAAIVVGGFSLSLAFEKLPMFAKPAASHYLAFFQQVHGQQGWTGIFASVAAAAVSYLDCLSAVVCPFLWPGFDWFGLKARYVVPESLSVALGSFVVVVCFVQTIAWLRSDRKPLAIAFGIHFFGVAAALLIWPRMARLAFPLFVTMTPVFWGAVIGFVKRRFGAKSSDVIKLFAIAGSIASAAIFLRDGSIPSGMWPQIKQAGEALASNHDPNLRIATDAKDLFLVTLRPQRFINASSMVMDDLNRELLGTHANHYGFVGRLTDAKIVNNCAYIFKPLTIVPYGFSMFALEPNYAGAAVKVNTLPTTSALSDRSTGFKALQEVVQSSLMQFDRDDNVQAAIDRIRGELSGTRFSTPGSTEAWLVLGLLELENLCPDAARQSFSQAAKCDYADVYTGTIAGGRESATALDPLVASSKSSLSNEAAMGIREGMAASMLASGRFSKAIKIADQVLATDPKRLPAWDIKLMATRRMLGPAGTPDLLKQASAVIAERSELNRQLFKNPIADIEFQISSSAAFSNLTAALGDGANQKTETWLQFAKICERENLPGLALGLLSKAVESDSKALATIRDDPEIWYALAYLNDLYGRAALGNECKIRGEAAEARK